MNDEKHKMSLPSPTLGDLMDDGDFERQIPISTSISIAKPSNIKSIQQIQPTYNTNNNSI